MAVLDFIMEDCIHEVQNGWRASEIGGELERLKIWRDFIDAVSQEFVGSAAKSVDILCKVADGYDSQGGLNKFEELDEFELGFVQVLEFVDDEQLESLENLCQRWISAAHLGYESAHAFFHARVVKASLVWFNESREIP
jgi:hypothetical protein